MSGTTPLKSSPPTECSWHLSNASGFGDPRRLQSAIGKLHSAVLFGGIAQLVERQLCKLEVRGSNPLASILIFDLRFAIADLNNCARSAPRNKIENRQSKFANFAAKPRPRACSSVG